MFFLGTLILLNVLRALFGGVPVIGWILGAPLIGFWVTAILMGILISKGAEAALNRRQRTNLVKSLGAVDTPHNKGKLGSLLLDQGRAGAALEPLEAAASGEPEIAEWHYRLGCARFELKDFEAARESLSRALELDDEYAYGGARMRLARTLARLGRHGDAFDQLETLERFHGPSPESAYRRGQMLLELRRKEEAHSAFREVEGLAESAAKFQKRSNAQWVWRAKLAKR